MVERCHRLYLRTLRDWQDQRRLSAAVVVQHARQVNPAGTQIKLVGG